MKPGRVCVISCWENQWEVTIYIMVFQDLQPDTVYYSLKRTYTHYECSCCVTVSRPDTHVTPSLPLTLSLRNNALSPQQFNSLFRSKLQLNFHSWNSTTGALWPTSS